MGTLNQPEPTFTFDFINETRALLLAVETSEITRKETTEAVIVLKNNKAAGWDKITGEMLKHGEEDLVIKLTSFSTNVGGNRWYRRNGNWV